MLEAVGRNGCYARYSRSVQRDQEADSNHTKVESMRFTIQAFVLRFVVYLERGDR
jgi:hypothetical protein